MTSTWWIGYHDNSLKNGHQVTYHILLIISVLRYAIVRGQSFHLLLIKENCLISWNQMTNCQIQFRLLNLFEIDFKVFKNNNHEHSDIRCWTAGASLMNRNHPNWHWNQPPLLTAPSHYLNQCWLNHQWGLHLKTISQGMLKISFWTNID